MAQSPAHRWGQIIGEYLEEIFKVRLEIFAKEHGLYLDSYGKRPARKGTKVSWIDSFKNSHDLDFVLERGGDANKIGEPVAFIESAWRRYTKHSRNKAQEIQGAVLPLVSTHRNFAPFMGVMLAGEFTGASLAQLESLGFSILYFPYALILKAFKEFGIDASTEEDTPEKAYRTKIRAWEKFGKKAELANFLFYLNAKETTLFFENLKETVSRFITLVTITPLHGRLSSLKSVEEAIEFVNGYGSTQETLGVLKYEIAIKYNNGNQVEATFNAKKAALEFLASYTAPKPGQEK